MTKIECKNNSFTIISVLLLTIVFLTACQKNKRTKQTQLNNWSQVSTWSFKGKIAINDGKESGSGRFTWKNIKGESRAKFIAPLGQGSWEIIKSKKKATLVSSQQGTKHAPNIDTLLQNEFGWLFPWNNLINWVRGHTSDSVLKRHNSLPVSLSENEWNITIIKWMDTPIGKLPKKIKATKPPYSLKVVIYQWEIK